MFMWYINKKKTILNTAFSTFNVTFNVRCNKLGRGTNVSLANVLSTLNQIKYRFILFHSATNISLLGIGLILHTWGVSELQPQRFITTRIGRSLLWATIVIGYLWLQLLRKFNYLRHHHVLRYPTGDPQG